MKKSAKKVPEVTQAQYTAAMEALKELTSVCSQYYDLAEAEMLRLEEELEVYRSSFKNVSEYRDYWKNKYKTLMCRFEVIESGVVSSDREVMSLKQSLKQSEYSRDYHKEYNKLLEKEQIDTYRLLLLEQNKSLWQHVKGAVRKAWQPS